MVKGVVSFTFDDGSPGWMLAAEVLEDNGFRGTFNATLRNVVKRRAHRVAFPENRIVLESELIELQYEGHEIASHGLRHLSLKLCNDVELHHELRSSRNILRSFGLWIRSFACPYNAFNAKVEKLSREFYRNIRGRIGFNDLPFKGRVYQIIVGDLETCINAIDKAIAKNLWVALMFHNVMPDGNEGFDYNLGFFEKIVEHAKNKGVPVETVSNIISRGGKTT